jgi:hypothetical protein
MPVLGPFLATLLLVSPDSDFEFPSVRDMNVYIFEIGWISMMVICCADDSIEYNRRASELFNSSLK